MSNEYRKKLLNLMSRIEQQIAEAESLTVEATDNGILLEASEQLSGLRRVLSDVEEKLHAAG